MYKKSSIDYWVTLINLTRFARLAMTNLLVDD